MEMVLYLAVDSETKETFVFTSLEELKEFAKEKEYSFDYYMIANVAEMADYDLGF